MAEGEDRDGGAGQARVCEGKESKLVRLKKEWDRVLIYLMFIGFGAWSLFYPIISLANVAPHWVEVLLSVEFILSGMSLISSLVTSNRQLRTLGLLVAFIGLTTISLVIAFSGGSRVLAYSILYGAFAMQCVMDLRRNKANGDLRKQVEELLREGRGE